MTDGVPDGRFIFINGNNTPRVAKIDLKEFETTEIIEIPNSAGNHASPFVTENTEYIIASTRFSIPIPQSDVSISSYKENFKGTISFIKLDPKTEKMCIRDRPYTYLRLYDNLRLHLYAYCWTDVQDCTISCLVPQIQQ